MTNVNIHSPKRSDQKRCRLVDEIALATVDFSPDYCTAPVHLALFKEKDQVLSSNRRLVNDAYVSALRAFCGASQPGR